MQTHSPSADVSPGLRNGAWTRRRSLVAACLTHALHDGYTDSLYAFLPVWQVQFGLSYAALAAMRALYYATMGGLQIPVDRTLRAFSARATLILSTLVATAGLLIMVLPFGLPGLCVGLVVAGIGSSAQHPRGSMLVTDSFGEAARHPLGIYNFSGDLGKAVLPAAVAALLPIFAWRPLLGAMAVLGIGLVIALRSLAPGKVDKAIKPADAFAGRGSGGFAILTMIGAFDTAVRMGYLLFLPFLIRSQHGGSAEIGIALAMLFIGGAFGKATCGWVGERLGVVGSVMATEAATTLLIVATLLTPLNLTLVALPFLGIVLNGTSSVLYGAVPQLSGSDTGRAFAVFYTSVIGSGGLAPILYGAVADRSNQTVGILAAAATAALIIPLVLLLRPYLSGFATTLVENPPTISQEISNG